MLLTPKETLLTAVSILATSIFVAVPLAAPLSPAALHWWFNAGWILSPLIAMFGCFSAARRMHGQDSRAWMFFGSGCGLWLTGTLYWAYFDLQKWSVPFPSLADAGYLLSSVLFMAGMFSYGSRPLLGRVQSCNFALVLSGAAVGTLELLHHVAAESALSTSAKLVAISYPILWLGSALFGMLCLAVYVPRSKMLPLSIILLGIICQAVADFGYGVALLADSYELGAWYDSGWVVGFALIAISSFTHHFDSASQAEKNNESVSPVASPWGRGAGEALVPVLAVAPALIGGFSHALTPGGSALPIALLAGLTFAVCLAVRENELRKHLEQISEHHRHFLALSPQIPWTSDAKGAILEIGEGWRALTGMPVAAALKGAWSEAIHAEDLPRLKDVFQQCLATGEPLDAEIRVRTIDGDSRWMRMRAWPRRDRSGGVHRWYGAAEDVHAHKLAEETLRESENLKTAMLAASPNGVAVLDPAGRYSFMNDTGLRLVDLAEKGPVHGQSFVDTWPGSHPEFEAAFRAALAGERHALSERWCTIGGEARWWEMSLVPLRTGAGDVSSVLGVWRDITEAKQARDEIEAASAQLSAVLESTTDSVLVINREGQITYLNTRAIYLVGGGRDLRVGANLWELYPEAVGSVFDQNYRRAFETGQKVEFEALLSALDIWLEVHAYPTNGTLSIFFRDVTERRRQNERLDYLAHHDHLTGLLNRLSLTEELHLRLAAATEEDPATLLILDLDGFKEVNDRFSHAAGDQVLKTVSERLQSCVDEGSLVARMGGDEFAILLSQAKSKPDAAATTCQDIIRSFDHPIPFAGRPLKVATSLGAATAPTHGKDAGEVLVNADLALYAAKQSPGSIRFFDAQLLESIRAQQLIKVELLSAVAEGQLSLYFQPLMDLRSNEVCALEALLRWNHPVRGLLAPGEFIACAEEAGLIIPIGEWVVREACLQAATWPGMLKVAVNLSPVQFRSSALPLRVAEALATSGLEPGRLELEITESVLLKDSEANLNTLHQLRSLGASIVLDDFGTGYSSLSYLHRFPFSKIKIDRSFVRDVVDNAHAQAIIQAVSDLGHTLGMRITAEGVETEQHLELVRARRCDEAQGFLFSRPVHADGVADVLARIGRTGLPPAALKSA